MNTEPTTKPCTCWHIPVLTGHGGHCCFKDRDICHPVPLDLRQTEHCETCGGPDNGSNDHCGICGAALVDRVATS